LSFECYIALSVGSRLSGGDKDTAEAAATIGLEIGTVVDVTNHSPQPIPFAFAFLELNGQFNGNYTL
jgi:hypothetical protein